MKHHAGHHERQGGHYARLIAMAAASYVAMYILMYEMVDRFDSVYNNVNQAYMAGLMAAPMVLIELALMGSMYPRRGVNLAIAAASVLIGVLCWFGIRQQVGVGDAQFLRSMIPHHSGAILMCEEAKLSDPDVKSLCENIIRGQQEEIAQMKDLLGRR